MMKIFPPLLFCLTLFSITLAQAQDAFRFSKQVLSRV